MLNSASRSRSEVGRTAFDFGPANGRERSLPPTTRIILALAAMDAVRRNDRDDVSSCHFGRARQCAGRNPEAVEIGVSGVRARALSPAPRNDADGSSAPRR